MAERAEEFRKIGVSIVAVSMSTASGIALYLKSRSLPFPLVADPTRAAYAHFGLGRTTWLRLLRPRVLWKYFKMVLRGGKIRPVPKDEDALQLGGDFLVDADRRVIWAQRGVDPTDRPTVDDLLAIARR